MEGSGSALYLCPHCGAFVAEDVSVCPNCGKPLEGSEEEEPELELEDLTASEAHKEMDIFCPECGSLLPPGGGVCEKCALKEPEEEEESSEPVTLYLCSECGAFTTDETEVCPNCGASLTGEQESQERVPLPEEAGPTPESEVMDMLVTTDREEAEQPEEELVESLKHIESTEDMEAFIETVTEDEESFTEPGEEKEPPATGKEERAPTDEEDAKREMEDVEDILSMLVYTEDEDLDKETKRAGAIEAVENIIAEEPPRPIGTEKLGICSNCGAFVSGDQERCGICGSALTDQSLILPEVGSGEQESAEEQEGRASKVLGKMLGVSKDEELPEAPHRFDESGALSMCTVCGAFLGSDFEKCNICGTRVEDMPEFVPSMEGEEELDKEVVLAICPKCGAFLNQGAKGCLACGHIIEDGAKLDKISPGDIDSFWDKSETAEGLLQKFLGVLELRDTEPEPTVSLKGALDLCPDCGAFVAPESTECPVCGSSLFEGVEDDIQDLESTIEELARIECPNCGSKVDIGSAECPICGLAFEVGDILVDDLEQLVVEETPGEDITEFLEEELSDTIAQLEAKARETDDELYGLELEPAAKAAPEPKPERLELKNEEILKRVEQAYRDGRMTRSRYLKNLEKFGGTLPEDLLPEAEKAMPVPEPAPELRPEPELEPVEEQPVAESLVWEEDRISAISEVKGSAVPVAEPVPAPALELEAGPDIPEPELEEVAEMPRPVRHYAVPPRPTGQPVRPESEQPFWAYHVYASVAAIAFFLAYYAWVPGDYSIGLALIFGILLITGIYYLLTNRGTFMQGDIKRMTIFLIGCVLAAFIVLHWPGGILTSDRGALAQPGLDKLLLSVAILLVGVGIIWIRARVRYVVLWFSGDALLLLAALCQLSFGDIWIDRGMIPSSVLTGGAGACMVLISVGFLLYEKAIRTSIESDIVRGDVHYLHRDFEGALISYDSALRKTRSRQSPTTVGPPVSYDVPWYSKGSALILMGDLEEGIKCLEMALAINPHNEVTWVNKGNAHSRLGDQEEAMECYRQALERNPSYEIAWNNMGNVYARQRDYVEALKCYNRALKLNHRYDDAWINKGYVLAKMGKQTQAMKCLGNISTRGPPGIPGAGIAAPPA